MAPRTPAQFFSNELLYGTLRSFLSEEECQKISRKYKTNTIDEGFENVSERFVDVFHLDIGNASIIQSGFRSPTLNSWKGLTFEIVVMNHIQQIKDALRIGGVISEEASFFEKGDKKKEGAQIDLLIIRDDDIVNLCEAKFVSEVYAATKKDETDLARKESVIKKHLSPRNSLHRTLITTFGLTENEYSSIYDKVITIDDLFRY